MTDIFDKTMERKNLFFYISISVSLAMDLDSSIPSSVLNGDVKEMQSSCSVNQYNFISN